MGSRLTVIPSGQMCIRDSIYTVRDGNGRRDYLYLPDAESRHLRLSMQRSSRGQGYGIGRIRVQSHEFSSSPNQFFETLARDTRPGLYPCYFQGEQSYCCLSLIHI